MKASKLISVALLTISLAITSCGKKTDSSSEAPRSSVKHYSAVSQTVGTGGGQIKDKESGLGLNIPSGALSSDTDISIQYVEDQKQVVSEPAMGFLGAAEFQPSGTVFSEPVEVSIELTEAPSNSSICVFCYDETNKIWDFVTDASINGKTATFNINHFSKYQCLDITESMYSKYMDLVLEAQNNGKSDSWITESYKDYLVNEKHVMDYYQEYGGYYYEPVGIFIGGKYQLNGKQGDGDDLSLRYGQSNKVGNTYGYSKVGGKIARYIDSVEVLNNTNEKVDTIDVTVTLDYKMIKPTIDLSSSKTKLKKGESTQVDVYCHYAKADNVIYPDFALPYYNLKIEQPTHLSINKEQVTTNESGKGTFKVTSNDGKADSVKVTFDVGGEFGTHAEGYISFAEDGRVTYDLSGTMKHEFSCDYGDESYFMDYGHDTKDVKATLGHIAITIEYSFTGQLTYETTRYGEYFDGTFNMSEINVDVSTSDAGTTIIIDSPYTEKYKESSHSEETIKYTVFNSPQITTNPAPAGIGIYGNKYGENKSYFDYFTYDTFADNFDINGYLVVIEATNKKTSHILHHHYYDMDPSNIIDNTWEENHESTDDTLWRCFNYYALLDLYQREGTQVTTLEDRLDYTYYGSGKGEKVVTTQTVTMTRIN